MNGGWLGAITACAMGVCTVWCFVVVLRMRSAWEKVDQNPARITRMVRQMYLPLGLMEASIGVFTGTSGNWAMSPLLIVLGVGFVIYWWVWPRLHPNAEPDWQNRRDVERWLDGPED